MSEELQAQSSPEFKQKMASLYAYLVRHLGIRSAPSVKLINSPSNSQNPFGFTGHYDHAKRLVTLYMTDRHDTDILRSFAHEIIHHWQNERGTLHPNGQHQSAPANGHYAQNDPWLRKREMEAYLFGNILFRDWQDECRYGPPATPTPLPRPLDENLTVQGNGLKKAVDAFVQHLIAKNLLASYDRKLQTGHMNPQDFAEDLSHKIMNAMEEWADTMNDRSDWENETNHTQPTAMQP